MRRSFRAYLWHVQEAGTRILQFTAGKTFADYLEDSMLRAACERMFITIGEALSQAKLHFSDELDRTLDPVQVIAFRNLLVHEYDDLDQQKIWGVVHHDLPRLLASIQPALGQHEP